MADEESGSPLPFVYLKGVKSDFTNMFGARGKKETGRLAFNKQVRDES